MNKLDLPSPSTTLDTHAQPDAVTFRPDSVKASLEPAPRLIVLVPADSEYTAITRRVWELANTTGMRVQFLSLCNDVAQEPSLRRQLVTISALVGDGRVRTESKVETGTNWIQAARRNYQPGDMIVCFAEQRAGLLHRPLSQILQSNLQAPVYILSGLHPQNLPRANWLSQVLVWMGSIAIIAASTFLQFRITVYSQDWAQTILLILSVIGEIWLIWGWNSLFS